MKSSTQSTTSIKEIQSEMLEEYKNTYLKTGRGITTIFELLRPEIEEMVAARNPVQLQIKTLEYILGIQIKRQTYYGWLKRNKLLIADEVTTESDTGRTET